MKKRKVFDAAKQRAEGTEIVLPKDRPRPGQPPPVRKPHATSSQASVRLFNGILSYRQLAKTNLHSQLWLFHS